MFFGVLKEKNSTDFHCIKVKARMCIRVCVNECVCVYSENGLCYKIEAVKRGASGRLKGMFYE